MNDPQQLPTNQHNNRSRSKQQVRRSPDRAEGQMLQILEDFLLLAEPDTIHQLGEHLASAGISLSADQVIKELGRLVVKAQGESIDD